MGLFTDLFSSKPAEEAAQAKIAGINAGLTAANGALDTGLNTANPLYQQAYGNFNTLAGKFGAGQDAYNDATGVNGQAGLDRAKATFTATPGYQSGFDLLTDANDRRAASRGILASGNTIADTAKLATTYADQNYGNYVSRLAPNLAGALSSTAGGAGVLNNQAGANLGVAGTKANLGYQGNTAIGNANADAINAKYGASKNFWSALMGGASILAAPFTGGLSLGGLAGSALGGANGGTASSPLPGLSASDYGTGADAGGFLDQYGLA